MNDGVSNCILCVYLVHTKMLHHVTYIIDNLYVLQENLYEPIIGITQAVRLCENNKVYLNTDTVVDFADREFAIAPRGGERDGQRKTLPLLDNRASTIVGVRVNSLNQPIDDKSVRSQIELELKKIRFNVYYEIPIDEERLQSKCFGIFRP